MKGKVSYMAGIKDYDFEHCHVRVVEGPGAEFGLCNFLKDDEVLTKEALYEQIAGFTFGIDDSKLDEAFEAYKAAKEG